MNNTEKFQAALTAFPCVAILRGLVPENALKTGQSLIDVGFSMIEVTLNSPSPLQSVEILAEAFGEDALIGAGTVLSAQSVSEVSDAGGEFIVSPHMDVDVIAQTKAKSLVSVPGVQTPTEAFAATNAGADALKVFPGEAVPPVVFKAMKAVLPDDIPTLICGGINPASIERYLNVGATGFGIGSALFKTGNS